MISENEGSVLESSGEILDLGYDPDLSGKHAVVICDIEKEETDQGRLSYPVVVELSTGVRFRGRAWPGELVESLLCAVGVDPLETGQKIPNDKIRGKKVQVTLGRMSGGDTRRPCWVFKKFAPLA